MGALQPIFLVVALSCWISVLAESSGSLRAWTSNEQLDRSAGRAYKGCSTSSEYDFFVFAQSWQPQFCHGHYSKYPGCDEPNDYWETHLTIHGLWPQNNDGSYPCSCPGTKFDPKIMNSIGLDTLLTMWPNVKADDPQSSAYDDFWKHEWDKHGTCSGLGQRDYFSAALAAAEGLGTPGLVASAAGGTPVARAALEAAYGGKGRAAFQCSGQYLSQVFRCLGRDGAPTACPASTLAEDSCPDTVHIAAFPTAGEAVARGGGGAAAAASGTALVRTESDPTTAAAAAAGDDLFYLLAMLWQPATCLLEQGYPGCSEMEFNKVWDQSFTIHGLWPNYMNGGWPQYCTDEKLDHSIIQNIGIENMKKIWPDLMFGVESYDFWEHEWDKHGTCTGIPQGKYFSEAISLYEKIGTPELISKNINKVLAREDVLQSFGGELPQAILLCDDENRRNLSQVYICFGVEDPASSADSGDLNLKRIPCPDSVASENTCGDDIVVPSYHVFSSSSSVSTV
mmetsp:Transcript_46223/g.67531  ORF Transcript_46223/g.67531 Transcript_46223/m.67531 type:complete len:509 (-) Transcript_46223:292-1818(-)